MSPYVFDEFFHKNEITDAPQGLARGDAFLFETEEIRALGAEKRAADQGTQLFRRNRTKASEFSLGSPRETSNSVTPAQESGAHDLADCRVGPPAAINSCRMRT